MVAGSLRRFPEGSWSSTTLSGEEYHLRDRERVVFDLVANSERKRSLGNSGKLFGAVDNPAWFTFGKAELAMRDESTSGVRHCGRIRDFSLGDREKRQMLVKTLRRRFPEEVHQTNIVVIDCRALKDPASSALRNHWGVHPTTLSKILNHHKFPGLLLELIERVMRFAHKDPKTRILIGFICSKARHRSVACSYLMQVIHTALNYSVNTRTTAIASSGRHLCNRDTCPDCSHLSVAAVRLMESVRERLVASWNKAVASAVSTSQHPKQSVALTSMPAIPVTPAIGKSWRITEKAPHPQPSKHASFFKGTLEQARLARVVDCGTVCQEPYPTTLTPGTVYRFSTCTVL